MAKIYEYSDQYHALEGNVSTLIAEITDEQSRKQLKEIIVRAAAKLETPAETIWRMIMSPHAPTALIVVIRMGVLQALVTADKPKTAKELAERCSVDEMLIIRMMRPLVALGIFHEANVQTYTSTPISETLMMPRFIGAFQFMFEIATRSLANMPRYLERTNFQHVDGPSGPFQDAHNTAESMFAYTMKDPAMMKNFNVFMSGVLQARANRYEAFPVSDIILDGASKDSDAVLLIDIGGGEGHDVEAFHHVFPGAGRLILQDLPPVIDNIKKLDPAIERHTYDFFEPQLVRGARAYYFRHIFHDLPDSACEIILKNTAAAMTKGYSKLLLFDFVLPARDVPLFPALLDINMMALLNSMERTQEQWTALLAKAGLKINCFHFNGPESEGLIEAELAD